MKKIAIILMIILFCLPIRSDETEIGRIDAAITYLLRVGLPRHKIYPWKKHPLLRKPEIREDVSKSIYAASEAKSVPAPILIAVGFREGSFRAESVGAIGETSMFQITPNTARIAKKLDKRCDIDTVPGSAFCAASLLSHWKKKCGTWKGSIAVYATKGVQCNPNIPRVKWITKDRVGIANKLQKRFWTTPTH
jgi:hypothetical protein